MTETHKQSEKVVGVRGRLYSPAFTFSNIKIK
jgi:hypothetical protein